MLDGDWAPVHIPYEHQQPDVIDNCLVLWGHYKCKRFGPSFRPGIININSSSGDIHTKYTIYWNGVSVSNSGVQKQICEKFVLFIYFYLF